MKSIRTDRLLLRPVRTEDIEPMFEIMSDPEAMRYWSTPPHESVEQTAVWIGKMLSALEAGEYGDFMLEFEGRMIGNAGFWKAPEIGYILHPDVWGRGLGREAVSAALAYGFEDMGLSVVTADVDPRNLASLALLEGLGFARTGFAERTFNFGGSWVDSVYLSLERPHLHPQAS